MGKATSCLYSEGSRRVRLEVTALVGARRNAGKDVYVAGHGMAFGADEPFLSLLIEPAVQTMNMQR